MRKLSSPITALQPEYDMVIIGSGYGGSIAASRFSRSGLNVCLLEKGKEFQAGEYPDTLAEAEAEMQLNTDSRQAKHNGLYEFHISEDISVFKGCGLGGTSLVNANVAIEPEDRVLTDSRWPEAIRMDPQSMKEGYQLARQMLKPMAYPENQPGYPELNKIRAMKKAAQKMGFPFRYADINVTFKDGINNVGVMQKHCVNCGDCVTGCNHSAKNSLVMNYLPDAVNHGAEIYCNVGVDYIDQEIGGWIVYFHVFNTDMDKYNAPPMFVRAQQVVLSGGTLGSTEILLRSKAKGLAVSSMVGKHFTGNGDVLGFSYNCNDEIDGIGLGKLWDNSTYSPVGPCIAGIIDMRNQPRLEDGITFEEGSIPAPIASIVNMAMLPLSGFTGKDTDHGFSDWVNESENIAASLVQGSYHGATNKMQTYLVMTHDDGLGSINLKNDRLNIDWPGVGKQPIFQKVDNAMHNATEALGGTFVRNLLWNKFFHYDLITVHPLGGCCMADDASQGVTDHTGNVFNGDQGSATFPGLYVLDGSIIPLPLGTNPLYTISAVTERACKLISARMKREIAYDDFVPEVSPVREAPMAVQFTESMKGFFSKEEKLDHEKACALGKQNNSWCMFTLTIQTSDMNTFLDNPEHPGRMAGTLVAPALSDKPLMVSNGLFNLFVKDPTQPGQLKMKYNMQLNSHDGKVYYFSGYKQIEDNKGFDLWKDTTVLYITVYDGQNTAAPVLGKGILKIAPQDFAIQATTMKVLHATNKLDSLKTLKSFASFFSRNLIDTYFSKLF